MDVIVVSQTIHRTRANVNKSVKCWRWRVATSPALDPRSRQCHDVAMTDSGVGQAGSLDPSTLDFTQLVTGFAAHMGLVVTEVSPDEVRGRWSAGPELGDGAGLTHRGVHSTVIESLASIAGAVWWGTRGQVVGVNNNTDFLVSDNPGPFVSIATPVQRGLDQQLWMVETTDADGVVVARGHVRLHNLPPVA